MSWISITIDDLHEAKIAALVNALSSAAKAVGQPDRAEGVIQGVVNDIRRKVASCVSNRVDADPETVPLGLRDLAVDMIIARLKVALEEELTEDERTMLRQRERELNRVADCKDRVDQPDNPIGAPFESGGAGIESSAGERRASRSRMEGL